MPSEEEQPNPEGEQQNIGGQTDFSRFFEQPGYQPQDQTTTEVAPQQYPEYIQWIIKLSGGKLKNQNQAIVALATVGIGIILIVLLILLSGGKKQEFVPVNSNPSGELPYSGDSYPTLREVPK